MDKRKKIGVIYPETFIRSCSLWSLSVGSISIELSSNETFFLFFDLLQQHL